MKKFFFSWIFPLIIAIGLLTICRLYIIDIVTIADRSMEYNLFPGEKIIIFKFPKPVRSNIVYLKDFPSINCKKLYRVIGLPGDSVKISNSLIFVNNKRIEEAQGVSYAYSFKTDSIEYAAKFLDTKQIEYNPVFAKIGIFQLIADIQKLKAIKSVKAFKEVKRDILDKNINQAPILASEHVIYWNKDHFGPLYIPKKGRTIALNNINYLLYKDQIEKETGKHLERKALKYFLNQELINEYTFKFNYYFLMNDKRSDSFDSRGLGLVPEKDITGSYIAKLPW